jgi:hypothetical protein
MYHLYKVRLDIWYGDDEDPCSEDCIVLAASGETAIQLAEQGAVGRLEDGVSDEDEPIKIRIAKAAVQGLEHIMHVDLIEPAAVP